MYQQTASTVWPSGFDKPVMQLRLDAAAIARLTGLTFERVLEDMGYELFAGCEVAGFGPVLFHSGEDEPYRNISIYVDCQCPTNLAIERISAEFGIPREAILWRREEPEPESSPTGIRF